MVHVMSPTPDNQTFICGWENCDREFVKGSGRGQWNRKYCDEHAYSKKTGGSKGKHFEWSGRDRLCKDEDCSIVFSPEFWLSRYCPEHSGPDAEKARIRARKNKKKAIREKEKREISELPERTCQRDGCNKSIKGKRLLNRNTKYCSEACLTKIVSGRTAERKKLEAFAERPLEDPEKYRPNRTSRQGETYEAIQDNPEMERLLLDGTMPHSVAASHLGTSEANVSRAMEAVRFDAIMEDKKAGWRRSDDIEHLLPRKVLAKARTTDAESPEFDVLVDRLVESYVAFQERFFEISPGVTFIVKDFHIVWIRSIIVAWLTGGKQLILSPPRHGKSELLIRFVVWAICLDFTVRVMWVAASSDVAKLMLGSVKDHLENNEALVAAVLPPGESFQPPRQSGKVWHQSEIKIAQMKIIGQKSSTMIALGRTSKVLSRDVDILIVDDLEDFDSTREEHNREYGRQKFAEIGTRKEEKTCWVNIGSRQHPEDLASHLNESASDLGWNVIVNSAHQEACGNDPENRDAHTDCVLFPEVRSYRWLMEKKMEMDDLGLEGAYDMRYLNMPRPTKGLVFRVEVIRSGCLDRSRDVGVGQLPPGRLIAGLDPAARGTQAAFCWLWTPEVLYMVDLETQEAGGFEGAIRIMGEWDKAYDLKDWKYESNFQQIEFFSDPRLRKLQGETGIQVRPYQTGKNKQDPELGLSAMAPLYHSGRINLPYGTRSARVKVDMLLRQLQNWTTAGKSRRGKTDVKMASWFPFPTILKWNKEDRALTLHDQGTGSYPGVTDMNQVGWGAQGYPGSTR